MRDGRIKQRLLHKSKAKLRLHDENDCLLKVGDYVFLVGEQAIKKIKCIAATPTGFRFEDQRDGKKFVYTTPVPYFKSGHPLFKNGLKAYPDGHRGLELRWLKSVLLEECQTSVSELITTYRKLSDKTEIELFFINILVKTATESLKSLHYSKIAKNEEKWYFDALQRLFNAWHKSIPNFGGIVNAMDCDGLFLRDFLELNVERARKRGVQEAEIQAVRRTAKSGIQKVFRKYGKS